MFTLLVTAASATKPFVGSFEIVGTICYPPDVKGEDKGMSQYFRLKNFFYVLVKNFVVTCSARYIFSPFFFLTPVPSLSPSLSPSPFPPLSPKNILYLLFF